MRFPPQVVQMHQMYGMCPGARSLHSLALNEDVCPVGRAQDDVIDFWVCCGDWPINRQRQAWQALQVHAIMAQQVHLAVGRRGAQLQV
jgi:hypothetical protein